MRPPDDSTWISIAAPIYWMVLNGRRAPFTDGTGCMALGAFAASLVQTLQRSIAIFLSRCKHPRSSACVVDPVVPVAGQRESPLQPRPAIGRIPALLGLGTGISPGAAAIPAGTHAGMAAPPSGARRLPRSCRRTRLDRCLRKHTPHPYGCTIAGHRLIGRQPLLHALEHLRFGRRWYAGRKQKKKRENLHHPRPPCSIP